MFVLYMNFTSMKKTTLLVMLMVAGISLSSCGQNEKKHNKMFEINKSEEEWKEILTNEQYTILRKKGTERPHIGKYLHHNENGTYVCAACGNELFKSESKFDSHCGWPSFDSQLDEGKIVTREDRSHGMIRTEILCGKCGGHLGHLFNDGPTETGLRYCVNSLSLDFKDENEPAAIFNKPHDTITLGGGCFWCVEAVYQRLHGVISVKSGFSGGDVKNPAYREVVEGTTGHAEVVQLVYDKSITSLDEILKVFFTVHDPTTLNRQGADIGTQYRSVIFFRNPEQKHTVEEIISELTKAKIYNDPIVTQVQKFEAFYKAENHHQNYFNDNKNQPYCRMVIQPKIEKFENVFKDRLKK